MPHFQAASYRRRDRIGYADETERIAFSSWWPRALVILAVALLFSAFVRWRLREMPLERDEGGMAYMGQLLLHGIAPYQHAYQDETAGDLPGVRRHHGRVW